MSRFVPYKEVVLTPSEHWHYIQRCLLFKVSLHCTFNPLYSQDYPEYYEVITEPVDLNLIRKNLEVIIQSHAPSMTSLGVWLSVGGGVL